MPICNYNGNFSKEEGLYPRWVRHRKAMLERTWEYLSRHLKIAWKSVFFNFKQYCCFFAAIFIVQMLYGMMAISATNNSSVELQQITDEYDYHYVLHDLTQSQYNYIIGYKRSDGMGVMDETKQLYVVLEDLTQERYNASEQKNEYDVYLRFGKLDRKTGAMADDDTVAKYCAEFEKFYVSKLASLEPSYATPNFTTENTLLLNRATNNSSGKTFGQMLLYVIMIVLAFIVLWAFLAIVFKNFKFDFTFKIALLLVTLASIIICFELNNASFWLIAILIMVLSVFLLMSIYNIRMNQYKFTYGVYMTFGADFEMLFVTAFWEMFVIMLVTLIPSVLVSTLVVYLIYAPSGFTFAFSGWVVLKVFIFSLIVVLASVFMPMRTTSVRQPMSLIITEDNSNLVTSPRKSFNLLGKSFPKHYELYSIWRFRKYNIQLLSTAIIFCALFICGLYLANIYTTDVEYPRPQYTMNINPESTVVEYDKVLSDKILSVNDSFRKEFKDELSQYGDDFANSFEAIENIEATGNATPTEGDLDFIQSPTTEAKYISSFMLVNRKNVKAFASGFFAYDRDDAYSKYKGEGSYQVTNEVLYKAVGDPKNGDLAKFLSQYKIVGDVNQVYQSKGDTQYCIIGDSISNISKFKFKVGDKIAVSTYEGAVTAVDSNLSGKNLLRKQIKNFKYNYTELTVCAIIKDIPSGSVPVYMLDETYQAVTGRSPVATTLNVYTYSPARNNEKVFQMNGEHITYIENALRGMVASDGYSKVGSIVVNDLNRLTQKSIQSDEHYNELYIAISILILCISPIIWFFSQIQYYFKREKEFNVIQSLGANGSDIRKIYLMGGLSMAVMSLIVSILLSYIASYAMFYIYNVVVPGFSGEYVRYQFYMPWYALVISIVMSVGCGFFSAYIPYKSYFKNRYSLENGGAGVKDDE